MKLILEPAPTGLMCDLIAMSDQVAIISPHPRFTWVMHSERKNELQSAYELRVTQLSDVLPYSEKDIWLSGQVNSDQSTAVEYSGSSLESHQKYSWQVRTCNKQGQMSAWSEKQTFVTGALRPETDQRTGEGRITARRYPLQQTPIEPVKINELGDRHFFLDFGRTAFGSLDLTLSPRAAGHVVTVHLGEAQEAFRVNRAPGGSVRYHRTELILPAGTETYIVPLGGKDGRMMPPEIGPVMPFRFVEVENSPSAITAAAARQMVAHYPFDEDAARFTCSNPTLNAIWELCRYTMKATSFCGIFVDGDRERLPYEADAYINQLGWYSSTRDYTLPRYTHEYLILNPTWPTEWQSHSVMMAWEDYLATGDNRSLAEFYDDLKAKSLLSLSRPDGLISTVEPPVSQAVLDSLHTHRIEDIVDWPSHERDGYEMRPVNTVVNAFYYRALVLMARIADTLHKSADVELFRAAAARAASSFNAKLSDPETGLYVDGEGSRHHSQHAGLFALAFGLVPPENISRVAAFVAGRGMACSVYAAQYLLEALFDAGLAEEALALMTAPTDRSWAHMVNDLQTTMTLEAWDNKYKPNQDWNHAWGAAPANIIPRKLMGVEATEPGFRRMRIQPRPGNLVEAALEMPTIRGTVSVAFMSSQAQFTLHLSIPANTEAQVVLPRLGGSDAHITIDGLSSEARIEGQHLIVDSVGSGAHIFVRRSVSKMGENDHAFL